MNCELDMYIGGNVTKAFLLGFFHSAESITRIIHSHKYAEVHLLLSGSAELMIGNESFTLAAGDAVVIPAGIYHCCSESEAFAEHIAFQVAAKAERVSRSCISASAAKEIKDIAKNAEKKKNAAKLSALLSFLCADFFGGEAYCMREIGDIGAIISEFVSQNYNRDIKISELAEKLHFSEKQTERLVKKYTGTSFKSVLTNHRLVVADFLENNTEMSVGEIAEYVGYNGYSGLWKARRRQQAERNGADGANEANGTGEDGRTKM